MTVPDMIFCGATRLSRCVRPEGHEGEHFDTMGWQWKEPEIKPGDFIIRGGKGGEGAKDGSVKLELADGTVMIELCPNGDFLVKGVKTENNLEIYTAFNDWLRKANIISEKPVGADGGNVQLVEK